MLLQELDALAIIEPIKLANNELHQHLIIELALLGCEVQLLRWVSNCDQEIKYLKVLFVEVI